MTDKHATAPALPAASPAPSPADTGVIVVPRAHVHIDWRRNFSRSFLNDAHMDEYLKTMRESEEFNEFTRTIREQGLINALLVRRSVAEDKTDKPYFLVAGYRRSEALIALKKDSFPVKLVETDPRTAKRINLIENLERESITTFNVASAAVEYMKDYKLASSEEVGKEFGLSGGYIRFLTGARTKLHPDILLAWSRRDEKRHPAEYTATAVNFLRTLTSMVPDGATPKQTEEGQKLQLAHFNVARLIAQGKSEAEAKAEVAKAGFEWKEPRRAARGGSGVSKVKVETIKEASKELRKWKSPAKVEHMKALEHAARDGALAMADYLCGKRKTVKYGDAVLFDPAAKEEQTTTGKDVK